MKRPLVFLCAVGLVATLCLRVGTGFVLLSCALFLGALFAIYRRKFSACRRAVCFLAIGTVILSLYPLCFEVLSLSKDTRLCERAAAELLPSVVSDPSSASVPYFYGQVVGVSVGEFKTAVYFRPYDDRFSSRKCVFYADSDKTIPALFDTVGVSGFVRPLLYADSSDSNDSFSTLSGWTDSHLSVFAPTHAISRSTLSRYADGVRLFVDAVEYEIFPNESGTAVGLRARVARYLRSFFDSVCDGDTAALFTALTVGDRSGISDERQTLYARAGILPFLCISGLHVMLFAGSFEKLLSLLRLPNFAKLLVLLPFLLFIGLVGGASGSVLRACIMAAILWIAQHLRRDYDSLSALAAAFLLLWLQNPYMLFDLGTQLSFAATAGLSFASELRGKFTFSSSSIIKERIFFSLCGSLYASGFTALLCTSATDYFCLLAPFSNLFAGVFFTPAMYLILFASLTAFPFPAAAAIAAKGASLLLRAFEALAALFAAFSGGGMEIALSESPLFPLLSATAWIPIAFLFFATICGNSEQESRAAFRTAFFPYPLLILWEIFVRQ